MNVEHPFVMWTFGTKRMVLSMPLLLPVVANFKWSFFTRRAKMFKLWSR